jgi:hypothetical protein
MIVRLDGLVSERSSSNFKEIFLGRERFTEVEVVGGTVRGSLYAAAAAAGCDRK